MLKVSRSAISNTLALGGVIIILLQTLYIAWERTQVAVILAGIIINQIGVWGLANKILPERRVYLLLRAEVDRFIGLVRDLNGNAVRGDDAAVEQSRTAMHGSVDKMVEVAAVESDEE